MPKTGVSFVMEFKGERVREVQEKEEGEGKEGERKNEVMDDSVFCCPVHEMGVILILR